MNDKEIIEKITDNMVTRILRNNQLNISNINKDIIKILKKSTKEEIFLLSFILNLEELEDTYVNDVLIKLRKYKAEGIKEGRKQLAEEILKIENYVDYYFKIQKKLQKEKEKYDECEGHDLTIDSNESCKFCD